MERPEYLRKKAYPISAFCRFCLSDAFSDFMVTMQYEVRG